VTALPALALAAALAAPPAPPAAPPAPDPLAQLAPLLGTWDGDPTGQPGAPLRARASFTRELDGKVVVRRNRVEFPPAAGTAAGTAGAVHEDLLVVGPEGGGVRATYWDNEGHVIRYAVSAAGGAVTFESEPGPGPRFRLAYQPLPDGRWSVTFSVAPPGGAFKPLQTGTMRRSAAGG
jgi:hypothetical protein